MSLHAPPTRHIWKFFRTGGLDQAAIETAADLLALGELDQKLWVALSCPVKGLELDEKTLALIDTDGDGHIHVPEVVAAVSWTVALLKQPAELLAPTEDLPLAAINDLLPEGQAVLAAAKRILATLGKPDATAISVADTADTAKILAARAPNGGGVVTLRATTDPDAQALINDILGTVGGLPDGDGGQGVDAAAAEKFFQELDRYLVWLEATAAKNLPEFGEQTGPACQALRAVRPKVEDYFERCRLAAFDRRATVALDRQEFDYLASAAKDLAIPMNEITALPLARVEASGRLPLLEGVNPAWRDALGVVQRVVVAPLYGPEKNSITADDWSAITARFAPYENWLGSGGGLAVEKIGPHRAKEVVQGKARAALMELIAQDKALAPEYKAFSAVGKLARFHRDLRTVLHNFVNFADFYSAARSAVFQAGVLYLDSRACELCIRVGDPNAHAALAGMSKAYLAYLDCRREEGKTMKIVACFTQGTSDYLFVGRNGLFYDRDGCDWDATITKIIESPISIGEAFWSPYKKLIRFIEEQVAKRASVADAATVTKLQSAATAPSAPVPAPSTVAPPAAPKHFDVGTIAALGVGLGAITTAFGVVFGNLVHLEAWKIPLVVIGVVLVISLPSMLVAWLKLRQRNLAPLLEANGWAINGRVKINLPFGAALTQRALLPANARRLLRDPYADESAVRRRTWFIVLGLLVLAGFGAAWYLGTWPFTN